MMTIQRVHIEVWLEWAKVAKCREYLRKNRFWIFKASTLSLTTYWKGLWRWNNTVLLLLLFLWLLICSSCCYYYCYHYRLYQHYNHPHNHLYQYYYYPHNNYHYYYLIIIFIIITIYPPHHHYHLCCYFYHYYNRHRTFIKLPYSLFSFPFPRPNSCPKSRMNNSIVFKYFMWCLAIHLRRLVVFRLTVHALQYSSWRERSYVCCLIYPVWHTMNINQPHSLTFLW